MHFSKLIDKIVQIGFSFYFVEIETFVKVLRSFKLVISFRGRMFCIHEPPSEGAMHCGYAQVVNVWTETAELLL